MSEFQNLVSQELAQARNRFPNMNSLHEGFAVLLEEVDELWDCVKEKQTHILSEDEIRFYGVTEQKIRNQAAIISELVQIAAMAQRIYEDIAIDGNKVQR